MSAGWLVPSSRRAASSSVSCSDTIWTGDATRSRLVRRDLLLELADPSTQPRHLRDEQSVGSAQVAVDRLGHPSSPLTRGAQGALARAPRGRRSPRAGTQWWAPVVGHDDAADSLRVTAPTGSVNLAGIRRVRRWSPLPEPLDAPRIRPALRPPAAPDPGCRDRSSPASSTSSASRGPSATTSTRPSSRLRAHPVRPSSSARARVHQRKPTPWTCPLTQADRRTEAPDPEPEPASSPASGPITGAVAGVCAGSEGSGRTTGS